MIYNSEEKGSENSVHTECSEWLSVADMAESITRREPNRNSEPTPRIIFSIKTKSENFRCNWLLEEF